MTSTDAADASSRIPSSPMPSRKLAWIAGIAILSLLPGLLVSQLVDERQDRETGARADIVQAWGPDQHVDGPTLVVPVARNDGSVAYLKLAPRTLEVKAQLAPEARRRGIFSTTVYEAAIGMTGTFAMPAGFRDGGDGGKAGPGMIVVGLSGLQGVRDEDRATIEGIKGNWQACRDALADVAACRGGPFVVVADADLSKATGDSVPFDVTLHVRGTGSLRFATAAKHTTVIVGGAWKNPSFVGSDLPRTITRPDGAFEATWVVDRMGRPRFVTGATIIEAAADTPSVGVDLIEGTPVYRAIARVAKYGLLIVILAFSTYVLFELLSGVRVTRVQYAMLAASLSLFTLLLLSVSELAGYAAGYAFSALMVTAQASLYTLSVTRRPRRAAVFASMLAAVFGFLYVLLGLESYALVLGSVAIFVVLSILMGVTQRIPTADDAGSPRSVHGDGLVAPDGR